MIFDHRTYTVKPGMMRKQLELYEKHGLQAQIRHLGAPVLYGVTETGRSTPRSTSGLTRARPTGSSAARRCRPIPNGRPISRRARRPAVTGQENRILTAVPFFEVRRQ
jgi:hypothetical protein